jgi:hypothetical protein
MTTPWRPRKALWSHTDGSERYDAVTIHAARGDDDDRIMLRMDGEDFLLTVNDATDCAVVRLTPQGMMLVLRELLMFVRYRATGLEPRGREAEHEAA